MTKREQIDEILQENAVDCANTYGLSMTNEDKKGIKERWRARLLKMREIDQKFCDNVRFKINE
tara:strand:- start:3904 stop:4092 length:189 start_codon:yes stop_codon:yes gene_type:complete